MTNGTPPSFTFGEGGNNITANPGYGNAVNTGFSPGQAGLMPPVVSKAVFQYRQWEQLDQGKVERDFHRNPLVMWLAFLPLLSVIIPILLMFIVFGIWEFGALLVENPFDPAMWIVMGVILVVAAYLAYMVKLLVWDFAVCAALLHMRHNGMLTPFFKEIAYLRDFDEHPEKHPAWHEKYPLPELLNE